MCCVCVCVCVQKERKPKTSLNLLSFFPPDVQNPGRGCDGNIKGFDSREFCVLNRAFVCVFVCVCVCACVY